MTEELPQYKLLKGSSSDATEEPFLAPQRSIQSMVLLKTSLSYNLENLLSP